MTWVPARKGWMTKYGGKMYSVSCRQLGTAPTKEASWRAANSWWERKQAELDASAKVDDEPNARLRSAFAVQAAKDHFERTGELPRKVDVDLGDGRPVAYSFEGIQVEAEAKARGVIESIDAAFAGIDPDRTVGGRAEEWYKAIRARANAGQTDVSRYGSYKRHLSLFTDWIGTTALLDSLTSKKVEGWYVELSSRVRGGPLLARLRPVRVRGLEAIHPVAGRSRTDPNPRQSRLPRLSFRQGEEGHQTGSVH